MKILHIITDLDVGGAEVVLSNLIRKLDKSADQAIVLSIKTPGEISKRIEENGVPVLSLNMDSNWRIISALYGTIKIIAKEKPDIINTWLYHADLLGFIASKLCLIENIVWNIRCSDIDKGRVTKSTALLLKINHYLSKYVNCIIVNSKSGKEWHIKQNFRPQAWEYIPNGYEISDWAISRKKRNGTRENLGFNENSFVIGMVARYDTLKDHDTFLKAMNIVTKNNPNVAIIMIGKNVDNSNAELLQKIKSLGLDDKVQLLGIQYCLAEFYASMDLLVMSSLTEGFPNVIGEAMSAGTPCISTDVGDASILIDDVRRIVPIKDPVEMASKIIDYIHLGKDEWGSTSEASRDRISKYYSLDSMANKYQNLYENIIG